jgi:hypothetical protein
MKDKYLILTKISDDKFNGNHPNGINIGSTEVQGFNYDGIRLGEKLYLYQWREVPPTAWTSTVESFNEENMILKTKNSTYKITIKDEN